MTIHHSFAETLLSKISNYCADRCPDWSPIISHPSLKPKTGCHSPETNQAAKITLLFVFWQVNHLSGMFENCKKLDIQFGSYTITTYVFIKLWCIWWWWWGALVGAFQCQDDYCGTIWCPRGSCKTIHSAPELPGYYFFAPMQDQSLCSTSPSHVPWKILIHCPDDDDR